MYGSLASALRHEEATKSHDIERRASMLDPETDPMMRLEGWKGKLPSVLLPITSSPSIVCFVCRSSPSSRNVFEPD